MWLLLATVASAAAVLSFAALRDLAVLCGFAPRLAWLLPLVIDAGAAAGCLVWLGSGAGLGSTKVSFARALTVVLLVTSVTGNAVTHYLTAYHLAAPWWLVVAVSAVAPTVLGAVVHLAVKVGQARTTAPQRVPNKSDEVPEGDGPDPLAELIAAGAGRRRIATELGVSEHQARQLLAERTNGVAR
jgi:hypothetical protein